MPACRRGRARHRADRHPKASRPKRAGQSVQAKACRPKRAGAAGAGTGELEATDVVSQTRRTRANPMKAAPLAGCSELSQRSPPVRPQLPHAKSTARLTWRGSGGELPDPEKETKIVRHCERSDSAPPSLG